jgi:hypothetical protein
MKRFDYVAPPRLVDSAYIATTPRARVVGSLLVDESQRVLIVSSPGSIGGIFSKYLGRFGQLIVLVSD